MIVAQKKVFDAFVWYFNGLFPLNKIVYQCGMHPAITNNEV